MFASLTELGSKWLGYPVRAGARSDNAAGTEFRPLPQRPEASRQVNRGVKPSGQSRLERQRSTTVDFGTGSRPLPSRDKAPDRSRESTEKLVSKDTSAGPLGVGAPVREAFSTPAYFKNDELRPLPRRPGDTQGTKNAQKADEPKCVSNRKLTCCGVIFGIWVVLTLLLLPREPQWKVLEMQIGETDIPALTGFAGIVHSFTGNNSAVKMRILVAVRATNPNMVGAEALPGTFNIIYKGTTIGHAMTNESGIPPWGSTVMHVKVLVDGVPGNLGIEMLHDMQTHDMLLPMLCEGSVIAKVGAMKVLASIRCDLLVDVSVLPKAEFKRKDCTYTYGLPSPKQLRSVDEK